MTLALQSVFYKCLHILHFPDVNTEISIRVPFEARVDQICGYLHGIAAKI